MPTFVHISDIHFGQEKRSGEIVVNNDIKERLIADAAQELRRLNKLPAAGILVTGDIAYAGKPKEYRDAGKWLDQLADAVGCAKTAVHMVPGNHDVDRSEISNGVELMLREISVSGEATLDRYLANATDRKILYGRFAAYVPFAEAYNCPLDPAGGLAGDKPVTLASGRTLRFIGLNTALTCSKGDGEKGRLVVGAKQRVLPIHADEELIVLAHHPMGWLQDGTDALAYIRSRARVLITGHEHNPAVTAETTADGHELLTITAGATVPPSDEILHYTYNLLDFSLTADGNKLVVSVRPRSWVDEIKDFGEDLVPLRGQGPDFPLNCPNFGPPQLPQTSRPAASVDNGLAEEGSVKVKLAQQVDTSPVDDEFAYVLLRFFRDLTSGQRIRVLVRLGELPDDWTEELSHAMERHVIDHLDEARRLEQLSEAMDWVVACDSTGGQK